MNQTYLDIARQGKNNWWRYLLGIILTLFLWLIVGGTITVILIVLPLIINQNLTPLELVQQIENFFSTPSLQAYLIVNIPFLFFLLGIYLSVRFLHQRQLLTLVGADNKIRFQRFFQAFGIWLLIDLISFIITYLLQPENLEFAFKPSQWFPLLACAIILTPIQTFTEELFFRGYILQGLGLITKQPLILMIINGILFMLPHLGNPEVQRGFLWMALYYFAFGVFCTLLTLKDNRLELALGVHAANNLSHLFVTTKDSALSIPAIWFVKEPGEPQWLLLSFLLVCSLFYFFIVFGFRRNQYNEKKI